MGKKLEVLKYDTYFDLSRKNIKISNAQLVSFYIAERQSMRLFQLKMFNLPVLRFVNIPYD